jgi:PAS domain S-box-containing protein
MKFSPKNSNAEPEDSIPEGFEERNPNFQLESILDRVSDAIVALDTHWVYTYVNEKAAQTFGRTPEQMIGKHIWTEFPEGIDQPFYKAYYRAVETQQAIMLEEYYPPYDRWFENRIYPSKDGLTIFFNDITEKKKAEKALHDSNRYNRMMFDHSPIGLALCRMDGTLVDVNDAYVNIIGYTRAETMKLRNWSITPDQFADQEQAQLKSLETTGKYGPYEKDYIHKDGHLMPVLLSGVMVEISNERFILSTVEDISKRKQMDALSRQQQAFINSLANTIPAIIYIYDLETQSNIYSNFGIERILNYTPQEITNLGSALFARLIHPDDLAQVIAHQVDISNVGDDDILEIEYRMLHANGKWRWLHSYERPFLHNPDRSLKQTIGIAVDITQQKHFEQEIELERNFSEVALESLPGIFYMYDHTLKFTRWNKNFEKVSGYTGAEIARMSPLDFFVGKERELLAERIHEVFETGSSAVTADFVSKDGTHTPHFFTGRTLSVDNQLFLIGVGIDITEQKNAQEILQRNEQILRLFVEHSPASIAMFDDEMRYLVASNRYRVDYALGEQDIIGRSHYEIFPEMPQRWKDIHQRCLAGAIEKCEEDPFPRADGKLDWVRWEIHPWYEKTDKIGGIILFSEVVTERVHAQQEIRQLNAELEQRVINRTRELQLANKELESFSYSVSHDLRAPLRAISGFASIVARRHRSNLNDEGQHYIDNIVQASMRMGQLIDDLLTYSRLGREGVRRVPVSLEYLINEIVQNLQNHLENNKGIIEVQANMPIANGDQTLLSQVFTNLIENAITYHKPGISPQVNVSWEETGNEIMVKIRDDGIGVPDEYQEKIFNMFQRLHSEEEFPGTGIGLANVKKCLDLLGGKIKLHSKINEGSTFIVYLPKE